MAMEKERNYLEYLCLELSNPQRQVRQSIAKEFSIQCNFPSDLMTHTLHTAGGSEANRQLNAVIDLLINLGYKIEQKQGQLIEKFETIEKSYSDRISKLEKQVNRLATNLDLEYLCENCEKTRRIERETDQGEALERRNLPRQNAFLERQLSDQKNKILFLEEQNRQTQLQLHLAQTQARFIPLPLRSGQMGGDFPVSFNRVSETAKTVSPGPSQTVDGKGSSNPLMAEALPKSLEQVQISSKTDEGKNVALSLDQTAQLLAQNYYSPPCQQSTSQQLEDLISFQTAQTSPRSNPSSSRSTKTKKKKTVAKKEIEQTVAKVFQDFLKNMMPATQMQADQKKEIHRQEDQEETPTQKELRELREELTRLQQRQQDVARTPAFSSDADPKPLDDEGNNTDVSFDGSFCTADCHELD